MLSRRTGAGQGPFELRAEVAGNAFLVAIGKIRRAGLDEVEQLGWKASTGSSETCALKPDPDGSPNYFMQYPITFGGVPMVDIAVRTLRQVLGVPQPGLFEYEAFDADGKRRSFSCPGLRKVRKTAKPKLPKFLSMLLPANSLPRGAWLAPSDEQAPFSR